MLERYFILPEGLVRKDVFVSPRTFQTGEAWVCRSGSFARMGAKKRSGSFARMGAKKTLGFSEDLNLEPQHSPLRA